MEYIFKISSTEIGTIVVQADSYEEAEQKASECDGDVTWGDVHTEVIACVEN